MSRAAWFLAGAGAGAYALTRARRAAEAFTPDGLRDRVNGLVAGARVFVEEFQTGRAEAEEDLRTRIDDRMLALTTRAEPTRPAGSARSARSALHAVPPPADPAATEHIPTEHIPAEHIPSEHIRTEHTPTPTPDQKGTHR